MRWFVLGLNPEPWAVGPVGYARKNGKMSAYVGRNQQLDAYKEAVAEGLKELLEREMPAFEMYEGKLDLKFYFWRNMAEYSTPQAQTHRKHEADGTNLAKATEDALQGILFANDKDVKRMTWEVVEQGPDVIPAVAVQVQPYVEMPLPHTLIQMLDQNQLVLPYDDDSARWTPPAQDEVF